MRPFAYACATDVSNAVHLAESAAQKNISPVNAPVQFVAGGTTLFDLMKIDVMRPDRIIDISGIGGEYGAIRNDSSGLYLGAFARMSEVADHPDIQAVYPVIAQSLLLAASPQLRNMATLAGNVLQRTRCNYFRDTSYAECNKREPGSGCAAIQGFTRKLAVLGVSNHCIAHYPGDLAQALIALDASVEILGAAGARSISLESLHRVPGDTPHIETQLAADDLITAFRVPAAPLTRRSLYLKIRDRESYEFALASAAVALDLRDGVVEQARIALGGVATKPWRAHEAERYLHGKRIDELHALRAGEIAFEASVTHGDNDFKPALGRRTVARALMECASLQVVS